MLVGNVLENRRSNRVFLSEHPDFVPPPAHLAYDAYHHTNWQKYYDLGLRHAELICDLLRELVRGTEIRVCEWGCGPARVIRHLRAIPGFDKIELFGTDCNRRSIEWCQRKVRGVRFLAHSLEPPLPVEDEVFDCVYAISVFTHLSEKMHYAWIEELLRTIKPGGILIFTTQGDFYARGLLPAEKAVYDSGSLVVLSQIREGTKLFEASHPPQFVSGRLLKDHVITKHIDNPVHYQLLQEVWVVEKH